MRTIKMRKRNYKPCESLYRINVFYSFSWHNIGGGADGEKFKDLRPKAVKSEKWKVEGAEASGILILRRNLGATAEREIEQIIRIERNMLLQLNRNLQFEQLLRRETFALLYLTIR